MRVWLVRLVGRHKDFVDDKHMGLSGYYARVFDLPLPPFKGLKVMLEPGSDGDEITDVTVLKSGAVLCDVGQAWYGKDDEEMSDDALWAQQVKYHTEGWTRIGGHFSAPEKLALPPE